MMIFALSATEKKQLNKWLKKHLKKCTDYPKAHLTYMFTPTGIGSIVEIECSCGKKVDVTDSSNW